MYVVWLLVFWRNVLNVSNFYIKCKSILNKGGLFPLCVFLLILQNDLCDYVIWCRSNSMCALLWGNSTNDQTVSCYTWLLTRQVNQQREVFYLLRRGRRLMEDYCPPCEYRKAGTIHYLEVGTRCRCHLLNDNSVSFHFTYLQRLCLHTFHLHPHHSNQRRQRHACPFPICCAIGGICQHAQLTAFWWRYK